MKKLASLLLVSAIAIQANSQKIYVQGGVNLANITSSEDGHTEDNHTLTTFNAGLMTEFNSKGIVSVETGLLFTGKGSKSESQFTSGGNTYYIKSKFNPYYIELPLNLVLKVPGGTGAGLFFSAGPYGAIGVRGKAEVETNLPAGIFSNSSHKIEFSNDDPFTSGEEDATYGKLKRFDYGFNVGAGINLKKFLIKINYGVGLAKINSTASDNNANDKNKYRTLSFSAAVPLSK